MGWIKRTWSKITTSKPRPAEAEVWKRLRDPAFGLMIFAMAPILIVASDILLTYPDDFNGKQVLAKLIGWQTLLAGTLAIMASVFTARAVVVQTASAEQAERLRHKAAEDLDRRNGERDLLAARSVMPLALSVLYEYVTELAEAADQVLKSTRSPRVRRTAAAMPPLPAMPASVIGDLQSFIRAADVEDGRAVADLLSDLQLLAANAQGIWARTPKGGGTIVMRDNYEALIGRAAVQHARLSGLFPYARREVDHPLPPTERSVREALNLWFVVPDPKYLAAALLYLKRVTSPAP